MKLSKIYANKSFKTIIFNPGINAILADVKVKQSDNKNYTHNLGKSKLIEVIDFLLLKDIGKKHWLYTLRDVSTTLPLFHSYEFYLELELNDGRFVTIKRKVADYKKVSFKIHNRRNQDFDKLAKWDFENIPLEKTEDNVKTYPAKEKLKELLNFDFYNTHTSYTYRKSIGYSLREQADYSDVFQLGKFKKGKDADWKPFMFDLLGFNGSLLKIKYEKEAKIKEIEKSIKEQEYDFGIKSNEKDKLIGQIQLKQQEREKLANELDNLNLFGSDKKMISDLVENIEVEISELNTLLYNVRFDINKIQQSIEEEFSFDLETINQIFQETSIYFPQGLKKSYEELIEFNKKLSIERNKMLRDNLTSKKEKEIEIKRKLEELHSQMQSYKNVIQESSTFNKLKFYQKDLIQIEVDLVRLQSKLEAIDIISKKRKEIKELSDELEYLSEKIGEETENTIGNEKYMSIRNTFASIVKRILKADGIISVSTNKQNNISFDYSIEHTAQASGFTYTKLICVAFDLAILINYANESYYKFVYHDDVFANQDNRLKIRLLDLIREVCDKYNIQYIFSVIKDEVPRDEKENYVEFANDEIVVTLHDKDNSGKLFEMTF